MNKKIFLALFSVNFVSRIGMGIVAPLMPLYAESLGASGLSLGIMFSSFAFAQLLFMPVAGRLSDYIDRKKFITLGLLAYTIISLFYVWAASILALTAVRFLHGLASCMVQPAARAYVGDLTPKGKEATYINLFSMSVFLGMGFGPFLGGVVARFFSLGAAFYVMTAVSGIALALLLFFVPTKAAHSHGGRKEKVAPVGIIIRDSRLWAAITFLFTRGFWRQGVVAFLPLLAIGHLEMTPAGIGIVLSAYLLTGGGVQGIVGPIVDRANKIALIAVFSTIGPLLLLLIPQALSMKGLLSILLPLAVLGSFAQGSMMAVNVETGKDYHGMGTIFGFSAGAHSMGRMIGPVLLGMVMDMFGTSTVFTCAAVLGCCGGIVTAWLLIGPTIRKGKNKPGAF